jgi:hypothetical protein
MVVDRLQVIGDPPPTTHCNALSTHPDARATAGGAARLFIPYCTFHPLHRRKLAGHAPTRPCASSQQPAILLEQQHRETSLRHRLVGNAALPTPLEQPRVKRFEALLPPATHRFRDPVRPVDGDADALGLALAASAFTVPGARHGCRPTLVTTSARWASGF